MAITTEPAEPSTVSPRRVAPSRGRLVAYVVAVLLALVALGAVDWTAHRLTHISMHGIGSNGGS